MSVLSQLRITQIAVLVSCIGNIWCFFQIQKTRDVQKDAVQNGIHVSGQTGTFERVKIVKPDGQTLIELGDNNGSSICLYGRSSDPLVRLDTGTLSFAHMASKKMTRFLSLGKTDAGGYVKIYDDVGNTSLELLPSPDGSGTAYFWNGPLLKLKIPEIK